MVSGPAIYVDISSEVCSTFHSMTGMNLQGTHQGTWYGTVQVRFSRISFLENLKYNCKSIYNLLTSDLIN